MRRVTWRSKSRVRGAPEEVGGARDDGGGCCECTVGPGCVFAVGIREEIGGARVAPYTSWGGANCAVTRFPEVRPRKLERGGP